MAPRTTKARQKQSDSTVTVIVDGVTFGLDVEETTATEASTIRRVTGIAFREHMEKAADGADLDTIGVIIWLARRHSGEADLTLDAVLDTLTYGADIEVTDTPLQEAEPGEA